MAFRDIATLRPAEVALPEDTETNLAGGAEAARGLGMNRLAERLENAVVAGRPVGGGCDDKGAYRAQMSRVRA